jgi:hypothetical protein
MMAPAHPDRGRKRALRVTAGLGLSLAAALAVNAGCSRFFDSGPDPADDGLVDGAVVAGAGGGGCALFETLDPSLGSPGCARLFSCMQMHCDQQLRSCFGNGYQTQSYVGSPCQPAAQCELQNGCRLGIGCTNLQNAGSSNGNAQPNCSSCLAQLANCERSFCQGLCDSVGAGGSSPGTNGQGGQGVAVGGESVTLVNEASLNAIAVDSNAVYFADTQYVRKVNKDGTGAMVLGAFPLFSGLALDASYLYLLNSSNSLQVVNKTGGGSRPLASWTCAGGLGSLLLDDSSLYLTSGPRLYAVPAAGGSADLLADDVAPSFGPAWGTRLGVDADNVYYAAVSVSGSGQSINGIAKSSARPSASCGSQSGTTIAQADGNVMAMTLLSRQGAQALFLTDVTSNFGTGVTGNALTPTLKVRVISLTGALGPAQAVAMATIQLPSSVNNPNLGSGLAVDPASGSVYFASFDGIYRMKCDALPCAAAELFVSSVSASALALDDHYLYYADQGYGPNGRAGLKKIAE